jgi:putative oxidoreductase
MVHGWGKIQNPLAWMGPDSPIPELFQFITALSEFAGGLALIFGFLTRLGALGVCATMCMLVFSHTVLFNDPFIHKPGGRSFEQVLTYLIITLLFITIGPGRFSLDRKIFGLK